MILRDPEHSGFGQRKVIDVWWGGLQANGGLMLVLAYLLRTNVAWESARVRLKLAVKTEAAAEKARQEMAVILTDLRIGEVQLDIRVVGEQPFAEVLREASADADIIFLGLAAPDENFRASYNRMQEMSKGLPSVGTGKFWRRVPWNSLRCWWSGRDG